MPRSNARIQLPKEAYPENFLSERIEKKILATLPALPRLDCTNCSNERLAILEHSVSISYLQFTSHTPDPFGCDSAVSVPVRQEIKDMVSQTISKRPIRALVVL